MKRARIRHILAGIFLSAIATAAAVPVASACTRAVYFGKAGQTVTGRTMDWSEDMQTNLWVFPRGMMRDGGLGDASLRWTSRYGSVVASVYEGGTADGMNERGLVANLLYLAESEYPQGNDGRPAVVITAWAQYALDNFATVEEAVAEIGKDAFRVVPVIAPNGAEGRVHFSLSDPTGDSAIFEYIDGKLVIHHGKQYQVMTNSPTFDRQLALNEYWKQIGGTVMLPGTNRAADRFARASFYINAAEQSADPRAAVAAVMSVMRNASVPRGISTPAQPNIASTLWRTVADQKNRVYFFEDTASPSLLWVDLRKLDFAPEAGVRKLTLHGQGPIGGDQTGNFQPAEPFRFLAPE
ncbi:MAG: linear amide C-N hydrolase [Planctomycetaceae bacterium]|nr:MAG: linear amide C-N hydrolase [Planctomycetaceae bacterium]